MQHISLHICACKCACSFCCHALTAGQASGVMWRGGLGGARKCLWVAWEGQGDLCLKDRTIVEKASCHPFSPL